MAGGSSSYGGANPNVVRLALAVMALGLAAYIVGPPLYWHLAEALGRASSYSSCTLCNCDCSSQPLLALSAELTNFTLTACHESGTPMGYHITNPTAKLKIRVVPRLFCIIYEKNHEKTLRDSCHHYMVVISATWRSRGGREATISAGETRASTIVALAQDAMLQGDE
ncbi:hypothetical protein KSP40_PGU005694 [Platanthera guangdongensis]|uniref:Uncharacterized protein n=1 Tax=Platanthera guangdongensis TaxID=2320717 RepID=A0ABR2LHV0_9ASPA